MSASAPPPPDAGAPAYNRETYLMEQFKAIAQRYEISDYFAQRLKQLEGFEIVLILDDSGSMNTPLQNQAGGPFAPSMTRWDELKGTVGIIVDIAAIMDKDGLDVYFLNRSTLHSVTSSSQLGAVFAQPPSGLTPITPVLQHVLSSKKDVMVERKLLVIIMTDGAPTNTSGQVDIPGLKQVMARERNAERCFVTFVACTDDSSTVEYLNKWDRDMKNVDVVDDYLSERTEIMAAQGSKFRFSMGDYVVKLLLGSIDPEFDRLDEGSGCQCTLQ